MTLKYWTPEERLAKIAAIVESVQGERLLTDAEIFGIYMLATMPPKRPSV